MDVHVRKDLNIFQKHYIEAVEDCLRFDIYKLIDSINNAGSKEDRIISIKISEDSWDLSYLFELSPCRGSISISVYEYLPKNEDKEDDWEQNINFKIRDAEDREIIKYRELFLFYQFLTENDLVGHFFSELNARLVENI